MKKEEIRALVRLLNDENPQLAEQAGEELVNLEENALPALRELADHNPELAGALTARIRARLLEKEWEVLAHQPDAEKAAILLARWLDPLLDPAHVRGELDRLAKPLKGIIPGEANKEGYRQDAIALRDWLAGAKRFRGNLEDYYTPENSLLPNILATKQGIPLSLSMIYLFVARRLGAPLYPVGMPRHFIIRYGDKVSGVLIDPFYQGALMNHDDCRRWLTHQNLQWNDAYLEAISDHAMVVRMLRNLINAYAMQYNERAVAQLVKYLDIWTDHHAGNY